MRIVVAHGADETVAPPKPGGRAPRTDVQEGAAILRKAGHDVAGLAVDGTPECLRTLAHARADPVFNLVGSLREGNTREPHVAPYYNPLWVHDTGSRPRGLS